MRWLNSSATSTTHAPITNALFFFSFLISLRKCCDLPVSFLQVASGYHRRSLIRLPASGSPGRRIIPRVRRLIAIGPAIRRARGPPYLCRRRRRGDKATPCRTACPPLLVRMSSAFRSCRRRTPFTGVSFSLPPRHAVLPPAAGVGARVAVTRRSEPVITGGLIGASRLQKAGFPCAVILP